MSNQQRPLKSALSSQSEKSISIIDEVCLTNIGVVVACHDGIPHRRKGWDERK